MAQEGRSGERTPVIVKPKGIVTGKILFPHKKGEETRLNLSFSTIREGVTPQVRRYPESPGSEIVLKIQVDMEKRIQWPESTVTRPDDIYHSFVTIPSSTASGLYLLSLGGDEAFTLLDITNDKAALYCPEGFWSPSGTPIRRKGEGAFGRAGMGMPVFFRVPDNLNQVEILLTHPARIKRADGSVAVELSDDNIGKLKIPVEARGGTWSIEPHISNFSGDCPQAFFKLLNVEPVVAFGYAGFLPEGIADEPTDIPSVMPEPLFPPGFVPGLTGQAIKLSEKRTLSFSRGERLSRGGYAYFPGNRGTTEFWFRADHSTHEIPVRIRQVIVFPFIKGPHVSFGQRYRVTYVDIYSMLQLELVPENTTTGPFVCRAEHLFRSGEWVHLACTWDIKQEDRTAESEYAIFLNGKKLSYQTGRPSLQFSDTGDRIVIGPFDGTMDILRISDVVRYGEDFVPPRTTPSIDNHTRALFLFDGDLKGTSAFSSQPAEAR
jgi:hypothetical protein